MRVLMQFSFASTSGLLLANQEYVVSDTEGRELVARNVAIDLSPRVNENALRVWDPRGKPTDATIVADFMDPKSDDLDGWIPFGGPANGFSTKIDGGLAIKIENLTGWRGIARAMPAGDWTAVLEIDAQESPDDLRPPKIGLQIFESPTGQATGIFHRPGGFGAGIPGRRWAQVRKWGNTLSILHGDGTYWIQDSPGFELWFEPTLLGLVGKNLQLDTLDGDAEDVARVTAWTGYIRHFRLWKGQIRPRIGAVRLV